MEKKFCPRCGREIKMVDFTCTATISYKVFNKDGEIRYSGPKVEKFEDDGRFLCLNCGAMLPDDVDWEKYLLERGDYKKEVK